MSNIAPSFSRRTRIGVLHALRWILAFSLSALAELHVPQAVKVEDRFHWLAVGLL